MSIERMTVQKPKEEGANRNCVMCNYPSRADRNTPALWRPAHISPSNKHWKAQEEKKRIRMVFLSVVRWGVKPSSDRVSVGVQNATTSPNSETSAVSPS